MKNSICRSSLDIFISVYLDVKRLPFGKKVSYKRFLLKLRNSQSVTILWDNLNKCFSFFRNDTMTHKQNNTKHNAQWGIEPIRHIGKDSNNNRSK